MQSAQLALEVGAASIYRDQRAAHLAQLVAPLDDMWAAFADLATPCALLVDDAVAGSCCVDEQRWLVHFFVLPGFLEHSEALLRMALLELDVSRMLVGTIDPIYLSSALDVASSVEPHTLLFEHAAEPAGPGIGELQTARLSDHGRVLEFESAAVGGSSEFLEGYIRERLERRELLLLERDSEIICVGELRRDDRQAGIAHIGLIVRESDRGKGLGKRMFASLAIRARAAGLAPRCSTEVTNPAARRAIEHAGFRATHRVLSLGCPARVGWRSRVGLARPIGSAEDLGPHKSWKAF